MAAQCALCGKWKRTRRVFTKEGSIRACYGCRPASKKPARNVHPLLLTAALSGCTLGNAGCIGAPFSFPQSTIDAGPVGGDLPDAGIDGNSPDAAPDSPVDVAVVVEAAAPEAAPDAGQPDAPTACSAVTGQPHDLCPLEPSSGIFPQSYARMGTPPPAGCPTINAYLPTPAACQCAETFNCTCLAAHGLVLRKCEDLGGAPWVY